MLEIEKEEPKLLLSRREILASFKGDSLSFEQAKNFLAKKVSSPAENIAVKSINRKFGSPELSILAYIYDSLDALKKFEPKVKEKTAAVIALEERKLQQKKQEKLKKEQKKQQAK